MLESGLGLRLSEPESALVEKLIVTENVSLVATVVIAFLNIVGWLTPMAAEAFKAGWRPMSAESAVAAFLSAVSLLLLKGRFGRWMHRAAKTFAILALCGSATVLAIDLYKPHPAVITSGVAWQTTGMTAQAASCFVLLGLAIVLLGVRSRFGILLADFVTFCLLFGVAILASGHVIGSLHFFGPVAAFSTSGQTLFCLLLLSWIVFVRKAERGVFSILLGRGIGSKIARLISPVLLLMPYFREGLRAHLFRTPHMPPHYITAFLATTAVAISMALLMYLAWRLNALEIEIQGLSLLDPLTGLYNLRGFRFLAEQSLLMARRSEEPFSVLFIDVDNLKLINDALGHQAGSDFLAATAGILRQVFRETDVLGRIGGDEFAVAGQFNSAGIADAALRLRQAAALHSSQRSSTTALGFSVGWVTSPPGQREPLVDLLAKADQEMYREKRRRKALAARKGKSLVETEHPLFAQQAATDPASPRQFREN